jgi:hypothetical protein
VIVARPSGTRDTIAGMSSITQGCPAMNSQEVVGAVLALPYAHQQQQALRDYLHDGYSRAAALQDADQRRRALVRHLELAKDCVCSLGDPKTIAKVRHTTPALAAAPEEGAATGPAVRELDDISLAMHQLQLVQSSVGRVFTMLKQVRYGHRHRLVRREYRDEDCGNYPLRDAEHPAVHVRSAQPTSKAAPSGRTYAYAEVEPFLSPGTSKRARAALYRSRLQARSLTAADLKGPHEQALIGQRGVFATAAIQPGTCVGVYGGQIMDEADIFLVIDDRYLINASPDRVGETGINGENLMSLTNTLFIVDAQGKPCGHPATGYNIEAAQFQVETQYGWHLIVHAFFAITEIRPGDELRWNYNLGGTWS